MEPYHAANPYQLLPIPTEYQYPPTIINGKTYLSIYTYLTTYGLVREDTTLGLVYFKYNSPYEDTTEQILYDYNWQMGDTIKRVHQTDSYLHVITAIDSTLINSLNYKVWYLTSISNNPVSSDYYIIEGIGTNWGPLFSVYPKTFEWYSKLVCFSNSSGTPIVNPAIAGYFDNATSCLLSTQNMYAKNKTVSIYPNPVHSTLSIDYGTLTGCRVCIMDITGRTLISQAADNKTSVDMSKLQTGIYIYSVCTDAVEIAHGEDY